MTTPLTHVTEEKFIEELENAETVHVDGYECDEWVIEEAVIRFIMNKGELILRRDHLHYGKWRCDFYHATNIECPTLGKCVDIIFLH